MTILIFIGIIFLTLVFSVSSLPVISEIMSNPVGNDAEREWVEIYGLCNLSMEGISLRENNVNHNIKSFNNISDCGYSIICDDCGLFLQDYPDLNVSSLYYSSFSLSNSGENISIAWNSTIINNVDYISSADEGMTFCLINESYYDCISTPGNENILYIENNSIDINLTNNESINITINQTINITTNTSINTSVNHTNNSNSGDYCNISLNINLKEDRIIFNNKEAIKYYNKIASDKKINYSIEYWIEDLDQNIVKDKIITSNQNEKSFTPSIKNEEQALIIKSNINSVDCNPLEESNLSAEQLLIIRNPYYEKPKCEKSSTSSTNTATKCETVDQKTISEINIKNVTYEKDNVIVDAYIYRGDSRKYLVNAYIIDEKNRRISSEYKFKLDKYSGVNYLISIPVDECGKNSLIIEGLDLKETRSMDDICEKQQLNNAVDSTTQKSVQQTSIVGEILNNKNFSHNSSITSNVVYESKNGQSKKISIIGALILGASIITYFGYKIIFRRKSKQLSY